MSKFLGKKIEFHILQSFPVSCLNRDDVGSPKTAMIGGVNRARVSSQAWKRQVRLAMHQLNIKIAVRTKHIEERILSFIDNPSEDAIKATNLVANILAKDTLFFFSDTEAKGMADFIKEKNYFLDMDEKKLKEKSFETTVFKAFSKASANGFKELDGLDIALFGRMVANSTSLNVEAAASFSHAISTHKSVSEVDFFTAIDDFKLDDNDDPGASHISTNEFNSATYYRYISLDLGQLEETLGGTENINTAVEAFTKALFIAVPFARQATQTACSSWDYAKVYFRTGQRLQASFDEPVKSKGEGYLKPSIDKLKSELEKKEKMFGSMFGKIGSFEWGVDENYSIDNLISDLNNLINQG